MLGGALEDFPTPSWCVRRLLEAWCPYPGLLVEPCAGSGGIIKAVSEELDEGQCSWLATEVNPDRYEELTKQDQLHACVLGDFLELTQGQEPNPRVNAVITNPPFTLAQRFVERCRVLYPNAEVVMLLRLGFLESDARVSFYNTHGVPDIYVLPNRPSFVGKGKTDSTAYGWFVWPPSKRSEGTVQILRPTDKTEKSRG